MSRRNPVSEAERIGDRATLTRRLKLAVALRHPPSATWADDLPNARNRKAPKHGGWTTSHHLVEWAKG
ncbi:MAG: hypothetical protein ACI9OJ_000461 [Myxococcota bacterium]|jgi:hypothetical protein